MVETLETVIMLLYTAKDSYSKVLPYRGAAASLYKGQFKVVSSVWIDRKY
jgi:hypothetical protein